MNNHTIATYVNAAPFVLITQWTHFSPRSDGNRTTLPVFYFPLRFGIKISPSFRTGLILSHIANIELSDSGFKTFKWLHLAVADPGYKKGPFRRPHVLHVLSHLQTWFASVW